MVFQGPEGSVEASAAASGGHRQGAGAAEDAGVGARLREDDRFRVSVGKVGDREGQSLHGVRVGVLDQIGQPDIDAAVGQVGGDRVALETGTKIE